MKKLFSIYLAIFLSACSNYPEYTGQGYEEESPSFYLSIAPSFRQPYEYEIKENTLLYREYSGLGGYGWGRKKLVAQTKIDHEQQEKIRALTLAAIKETIIIEEERKKSGEMILVTDGITWYLQSDSSPFLSIRTNLPESEAFYRLHDLLNSILGLQQSDA